MCTHTQTRTHMHTHITKCTTNGDKATSTNYVLILLLFGSKVESYIQTIMPHAIDKIYINDTFLTISVLFQLSVIINKNMSETTIRPKLTSRQISQMFNKKYCFTNLLRDFDLRSFVTLTLYPVVETREPER